MPDVDWCSLTVDRPIDRHASQAADREAANSRYDPHGPRPLLLRAVASAPHLLALPRPSASRVAAAATAVQRRAVCCARAAEKQLLPPLQPRDCHAPHRRSARGRRRRAAPGVPVLPSRTRGVHVFARGRVRRKEQVGQLRCA